MPYVIERPRQYGGMGPLWAGIHYDWVLPNQTTGAINEPLVFDTPEEAEEYRVTYVWEQDARIAEVK